MVRALCDLLGYPSGAAAELLDGTPKLHYCTTPFSRRFLPWKISGLSGRDPTISSCGTSSHDAVRVPLTSKS